MIEGDRERGLAYQRGRSTLTYAKNATRRTSIVEFLLVWRRDATGMWRIVTDAYWQPS